MKFEITPDVVIRRALAFEQECPWCHAKPGKPCMHGDPRDPHDKGAVWRSHCAFCEQPGSYAVHRQRWERVSPLIALALATKSVAGLPRICYGRSPDHLPGCPKMKGGKALREARERRGLTPIPEPSWLKKNLQESDRSSRAPGKGS